jgi:hypothetical protein
MSNYEVYSTDLFDKLFFTLDGAEQNWIKRMKEQLEEFISGKPLHFSWFREKKFENKRLYFLVDEERKRILFVSFASKKEQQNIIDFILDNRDNFFEILRSF